MKKSLENIKYINFERLCFPLLLLLLNAINFGQTTQTLRGNVVDQFNSIIANARVTLKPSNPDEKTLNTQTDENGNFVITGTLPKQFKLQIEKEGFKTYETPLMSLGDEKSSKLNITLEINQITEKVDIGESDKENTLGNIGVTVLKEEDIESLPEQREAFEAAIRALSPFGDVEITVDGVAGKKIPPKSAIKEIKIINGSFSAEFQEIRGGRIQIFTKIGSTTLNGSVSFTFNDSHLNAVDPLTKIRPPFQSKGLEIILSDSYWKKRATYFLLYNQDSVNEVTNVDANILDDKLNILPLKKTYQKPTIIAYASLSNSFQLAESKTLTLNYDIYASKVKNAGVGDFSLFSQKYDVSQNTQTLQANFTSAFSGQIANEFRFSFTKFRNISGNEGTEPTLNVKDSFVGGGANGKSIVDSKGITIEDIVTRGKDKQTLRFGIRANIANQHLDSSNNLNGTFLYTGGLAPVLSNNSILFDNSKPILEYISSIERYRRTLYYRAKGLSSTQIREFGGGASRFSINRGDLQISNLQSQIAGFIQSDWMLRPNLMLNAGVRVETQNNLAFRFDPAPRFGFAWASTIDTKKTPIVLRGGIGIYYQRIGQDLILDSKQFSNGKLQVFDVNDANVIDSLTSKPTANEVANYSVPQTLTRLAPEFRSPMFLQFGLYAQRKLNSVTNFGIGYTQKRTNQHLRSRNIISVSNASNASNLSINNFQYESAGKFVQQEIAANLSTKLFKNVNLNFSYQYNFTKSDTDGKDSFPVNQNTVIDEFGRSSLFSPHKLTVTSNMKLPFKISAYMQINVESGKPFNIILGEDLNGDNIFNDRPFFATSESFNTIKTKYGNFDHTPNENSSRIPRNYGRGKMNIFSSIRLTRNFPFNFGKKSSKPSDAKRFRIAASVTILNPFNLKFFASPIGNLSSPFFDAERLTGGQYNSLKGPRSISMGIFFNF